MLYEISNLVCAYGHAGKKVLHVEELLIPERKIIVILGLSGIGKSTFLETLGLMNNTIVPDNRTIFRFRGNGHHSELDFSSAWSENSDSYLSKLRNQHFSFIFQDTNLMPNFTAIENIMLTLMLQGHTRKQSRQIAIDFLDKVGMGEIDPDKKVFELSGGQRQRIAFIRAICPDFTVLLGDEPTGNLDRFTSRKLMQILQSSIHEKEGSAIIVSHDVELSIAFADQLIIINKNQEEEDENDFHGLINSKSVFNLVQNENSRKWKNGKGLLTDNQMTSYIQNLLNEQSKKSE